MSRARRPPAIPVRLDKLAQVGVLYHGLEVLSGGAILGGLVLGAVGFAVTPPVAFAYAAVAAFLLALSRMPGKPRNGQPFLNRAQSRRSRCASGLPALPALRRARVARLAVRAPARWEARSRHHRSAR